MVSPQFPTQPMGMFSHFPFYAFRRMVCSVFSPYGWSLLSAQVYVVIRVIFFSAVRGSIRRGARAVRARCMRGAGTGVVP